MDTKAAWHSTRRAVEETSMKGNVYESLGHMDSVCFFSFRFGSHFERIFFSKRVTLIDVSLLVCYLNVFYK